MFIVVDIETVANEAAKDYFSRKKLEAPSNYKDEAKISAYIEERRNELYQKAGIKPWTGKVICIGALPLPVGEPVQFYGDDEKQVLTKFGDWLSARTGQLVGKNSKGFDFPFLVGRYIAHDLGVPGLLRMVDRPRDIDECFGHGSQSMGKMASLSDFAWLMGMSGKLSHGSEVQAMYNETAFNETKWDEIVKYCGQDVAITAEFLRRYMKPFLTTACDRLEPFTEMEVPF